MHTAKIEYRSQEGGDGRDQQPGLNSLSHPSIGNPASQRGADDGHKHDPAGQEVGLLQRRPVNPLEVRGEKGGKGDEE